MQEDKNVVTAREAEQQAAAKWKIESNQKIGRILCIEIGTRNQLPCKRARRFSHQVGT